jgi:Zn-dependent protease with chaperone function
MNEPFEQAPDKKDIMPASQPVMLRALRWGAISTVALIIVAGGIGYLVADTPGLWGGVVGALFSGLFVALTAGSIAFGNHFIDRSFYLPAFFGIVMGSWVLKFIIFLVAAFILTGQEWLNLRTLFVTIVVGVVLSLALDVWIMLTSRIPTVSDLVLREHQSRSHE